MQPVESILTQGGLGVMAGTFLWLYLSERKDHKDTRRMVDTLQEARRVDAVEARVEITSVATASTDAIKGMSEKIKLGKKR